MEKLTASGRVKSIGVSNFNAQQLERIMKCAAVPPAVNQVECHLYLQQNELLESMKRMNVTMMAYAPLGSPDRPE